MANDCLTNVNKFVCVCVRFVLTSLQHSFAESAAQGLGPVLSWMGEWDVMMIIMMMKMMIMMMVVMVVVGGGEELTCFMTLLCSTSA